MEFSAHRAKAGVIGSSIFAGEILSKQRIFDPTETFKQMDTSFSLATSQRVSAKIENIDNAPDSSAKTTIEQQRIVVSGQSLPGRPKR